MTNETRKTLDYDNAIIAYKEFNLDFTCRELKIEWDLNGDGTHFYFFAA